MLPVILLGQILSWKGADIERCREKDACLGKKGSHKYKEAVYRFEGKMASWRKSEKWGN